MKIFYLAASILMTVLILIFSFENVMGICSYMNFLFFDISSLSPTVLLLGTSFIGIITGIFYAGFLHSLFSGKTDEMDEDENF